MLAQERRRVLITEVHQHGQLVTSEMASRLGVSEVTLRADLDELERQGRVQRTHGGAVVASSDSRPIDFDLRVSMQHEQKRRIGAAAASLIEDNQTVIFDAGTTVHYLAQQLPEVNNLTVYTPAINVAQQLLGTAGVDLNLMGGRVNPTWMATTGSPRQQGIKDLLAQKVFLASQGVDGDLDVGDVSADQAATKIHLVRRARMVVLLADSTKWEREFPHKVMSLRRVNVVITDDALPERVRHQVRELGIELIVT